MRVLVVLAAVAPLLGAADPREQFEMQVRPVLAKNCWGCHGPSAMAGLRLDSREAILKGGKSGPAVVPDKPADSLLIQAVTHRHERLKMPPGGKLPDSEIDILTTWIAQGAYWPPETPTAASTAKAGEYRITPEQRDFWSFQPVKLPALPTVRNAAWGKHPIDRFILSSLEAKGLQPVPAADKRTLIRRASFDLTGLPPAPDQVEAFLKDRSPDAFAKVVDRLLASPQYGERWGRYWLDVARYSDDSMGSSLSEPVYPSSFRYRNWVIDAFNHDMPYNLFVKAQIAGDSMPAPYAAGLGFYALSPEMQDERVDATTRGFLGLTVACAQCHDHKFDPIPTKDFYSLQAIFNNSQTNETPLTTKEVVDAWQAQNSGVEKQQKVLDTFLQNQREQLNSIFGSQTAKFLLAAADQEPETGLDEDVLKRWQRYLKDRHKDHPFLNPWFDAVAHNADAAGLRAAAGQFQGTVLALIEEKALVDEKNRIALGLNPSRNTSSNTALQSLARDKFMLWRDLFEKSAKDSSGFFQSPDGVYYFSNSKVSSLLGGVWKTYLDSQQQELKRLKAALPPKYPFLQTIKDRDQITEGRVLIRGDRNNPGDVALRRFLTILSPPEHQSFTRGSGRQELAEAIADPQNPLIARVIVNRVWQHHFGRGIVATASNFGQMGERPTHPELLDYLASSLVEHGWSLKWLHREIMLSAVYQLSAAGNPDDEAKDAQNLYLWRANRRRLDAEALRDSVLFAAGTLDPSPADAAKPLDEKNHRRTVYGFISRRRMDPMLALFDFPNPNTTGEDRVVTNVPLQRLFFMNSAFMESAAAALADRFPGAPESRIRGMYLAIFSREPDAAELKLGLDYTETASWSSYARALLDSNEFSFVD